MKKFTFLMIALLCTVVTFAAGPKKQFTPLPFTPANASVQLGKQMNAKEAPATLAKKIQKAAKAKAKAPKKAVAAADLVSDYQWDYQQASELSTEPDTLEKDAGSVRVSIALGEAEPTEFEADFYFNSMDVKVSNNASQDGDINEAMEITKNDLTLTISPKDEDASSPNRFWDTSSGPQLRVYSGTLTFDVPEGMTITEIVFNHNGKWGANTVGEETIPNDADNKVATWTGEAQQVVVAIGGNSQINSIEVTYGTEEEVVEGEPIVISGMFPNDLKATLYNGEEYDYFVIPTGQTAGTSSYGDYTVYSVFYYEGDEEYEAGWYNTDIYGYVQEDGTIYLPDWICRKLITGSYVGYNLTPYWVEGSTLTPVEPLTVVELPEGAEPEEYSMFYEDEEGMIGAVNVNVAVVGDDVYVQGFSYYIPEAWVKGTKDGNTVTFPEMQYMGVYYGYESYAFYEGPAVFVYDAEADTYTAEGEIFGVLGDTYYDGRYFNPVIKKVVEKAAMPADPVISALTNSTYGWYFTFNVPVIDTNGDPLVTSKLSYMIYTDVEGVIAPLTFTPATHTMLTEDITEIPYGFTEGYDFYDTQIYLNDLYSADWNNLGIQSIYRGGDEENITEIQWFHIKDYTTPIEVVTHDYTFNFLEMDVPTSDNNGSTDGDITETVELTEGDVTLAISPKDGDATTENRFWATKTGPQLRVYSGTLTFNVPDGCSITQIEFNHNGKWGATAEPGEIENDDDSNVATWTGDAQEVVFTITANSQINSIQVTVEGESGEEPDGVTYTFDDGTLDGWTTIDADGDGYTWMNTAEAGGGLDAHNSSNYAVFSQSYANSAALTPDNYLISPKVELGGKFSFFAVAQDKSYPAEHFGVFVSTKGNTDPADFKMVEEWTLTAARSDNQLRAPRKVQGRWYQYIVDLSEYEGQEGYVAIRHFDCTDNFYMLVDDITFGTPAEPDPEPEPEELVELPEGVEPIEYTLTATGATSMSTIDIEDTKLVAFDGTDVYLQGLAYYFPDAFVKGTLTADGQVLIPTGQFVGEDEYGLEYLVALDVDEEGYFLDAENIVFDLDVESGVLTLVDDNYYGESSTKDADGLFDYFEEAVYTPGALVLPDPVVAPEDLETETWYLACDSYNGKIRAREVQVGFSNGEAYIQGLCEYLPEAWVKGTVEGNTITFESGQFYGVYYDQYRLFFVGYDEETDDIADVVFTLDEEAGLLTTDQWIVLSSKQNSLSSYDYYYNVVISEEMPELPETVEVPEDLVTEPYHFKGFDTYYEEDITGEVQVGFYGENLVYIQGLSDYVEDAWVVGTLEGATLTIPETYMGIYQGFFSDSEVFFSGTTFIYDAKANTFTSAEGYVTYENPDDEYMMDEYTDVVLTKLNDVAAVPADPEILELKVEGTSYPNVKFNIPTESVEGEPLIQGKLAYQLFIVKDKEILPLTLTTDLYDLEEDMTEIPYGFTDNYDIYTGTIYLNQGSEEIASWTNIGIQSIYYGGGEVNMSNVAWYNAEDPLVTGIASMKADGENTVIFDLQGRRVAKAGKGLYIANGKKVVVK
jgi:hypothetical protein